MKEMKILINEADAVEYVVNLLKRKNIDVGIKGKQFIANEIETKIKKTRVAPIIYSKWMIDNVDGKFVYQCIHCKSYHDTKSKYCEVCGAEMKEVTVY